jgi:hypothetical protein
MNLYPIRKCFPVAIIKLRSDEAEQVPHPVFNGVSDYQLTIFRKLAMHRNSVR